MTESDRNVALLMPVLVRMLNQIHLRGEYMKKILLVMLVIPLLLLLSSTYSYCEKESLPLSVDEALTLLKNLDPNITVTAVKPSPVGGLWEVDIEGGGKKGLVYLDSTKKNFILSANIAIPG